MNAHLSLPQAVSRCQAMLFDLDGVLVPTTPLHMQAWQDLFDEASAAHAWHLDYSTSDYFTYVDGKQRYDGVDCVLRSRGIDLTWGNPDDDPTQDTVCGLANRKDALFHRLLENQSVRAYDGTEHVLAVLRQQGKAIAVVSSSRNASDVLNRAELTSLIDLIVDGKVAAAQSLTGKPAPDTFEYAARMLNASADRCVVIEDALSGVAAGRAGDFGLVVGVDRGVGADGLLNAGADVVIDSLADLLEGGDSAVD